MDILSFIAAIVGNLAWPLAVVGIALIFRRSLAKLIPGISRLKYKGVEVEFGRQIEEIKADLGPPPVPLALPRAAGEDSAPPLELRAAKYFQSLAEISPRAAILEAWIEFEMAANRAVEALRLAPPGRPLSMPRLFDVLRQREVIGPAEVDALTRLRALRNQVVHGPEPEISTQLIGDYAGALRQITNRVEQFVQRTQGPS